MKRALLVAFHFAPENTSGTHRSLHFARRLVDEGIEVTAVNKQAVGTEFIGIASRFAGRARRP